MKATFAKQPAANSKPLSFDLACCFGTRFFVSFSRRDSFAATVGEWKSLRPNWQTYYD